jgi:hypothetical protein
MKNMIHLPKAIIINLPRMKKSNEIVDSQLVIDF